MTANPVHAFQQLLEEILGLLDVFDDLTASEQESAEHVIRRKLSAVVPHENLEYMNHGATQIKTLVSIRKALESHGMPSDGLSVFIEAAFKAKIDRNVDGNMALYEQDKVDNEAKPPPYHKTAPSPCTLESISIVSGGELAASQVNYPIFLKYDDTEHYYIVVGPDGLARNWWSGLELNLSRIGKVTFAGAHINIEHRNSSHYAMITMTTAEAAEAFLDHLGRHWNGAFRPALKREMEMLAKAHHYY